MFRKYHHIYRIIRSKSFFWQNSAFYTDTSFTKSKFNKKIILSTSKRDTSAENPMFKKTAIKIQNKFFQSSFNLTEILHSLAFLNTKETLEKACTNTFQHVFSVNPANSRLWLHPIISWIPRRDVHSSEPRWLCNVRRIFFCLVVKKIALLYKSSK